jgi:cysteine desulfurase family protein
MIYLDNAATTFPKPEEVYLEMDKANRNYAVNAGRGSYRLAQYASKVIDETRLEIVKLLHGNENTSVVLVPSVTIALNQIFHGIRFAAGDIVYVSPFDHNAVARTLHLISKKRGIIIKELPIKEETLEIDLDKLRYLFSKERPKCVCVTHVSNVTGYILPVEDLLSEAKEYGAITVLDASQSLGLIEVNVNKLKADFIAFAGHKTLYGPFGVAGFIINGTEKLEEFIVGGTGSDSLNLDMPQRIPNKYEAASPNIVAIAGLNAALKWLNVSEIYEHEKFLSSYLIEQLQKISNIKLYLPNNKKNHISIVSFNIGGYKAEDVGVILDEDFDIAVRTGYHCAPFIHKYLKDTEFLGSVRVGLGRFSTKEDVDALIGAIQELCE